MTKDPRIQCPDCDESLSRREFVRNVVGVAAAGGLLPLAATPGRVFAAPSAKSAAEIRSGWSDAYFASSVKVSSKNATHLGRFASRWLTHRAHLSVRHPVEAR